MIVFWRLFLSMYMADVILFRKLLKIQAQNRLWATLIRTVIFLVSAFWLCRHYLTLAWPFFGVIDLPGWLCLLLFGAFYAGVHQFFNFGGQIRGGYLLTFFVKNTFLFLFLFLCTPYLVVYNTGNFFAQPWIIFCVGIVISTYLLKWLFSALEQDRYQIDDISFDEHWMLMMMRLIFYVIMLLPGIRWCVLLVIWFGACVYARNNRLLDVSKTVFYLSIMGSVFIGLLVRLRMYWIG